MKDVATPWLVFDGVLVVSMLAGLIIVIYRDMWLPQRFFYDGLRIQGIAQGTVSAYGDSSYAVVGAAYGLFGLGTQPLLASLLGFAAACLVVLRVRYLNRRSVPRWWITAMAPIVVLLAAVYLGFFSKDVFVLLVVALVLWLPRGRLPEVALVVSMLAYAYGVRQYWYFVVIIYCALRFLQRRGNGLSRLLLGCLVSLVGASLAIYFILGVSPDYFRTTVNEVRGSMEDAASVITPFVTWPEPLGGTFNVVMTWIGLVIPVPLLLLGGAYYATLAIVIGFLWSTFIVAIRRFARADMAQQGFMERRSLSVVLAFVTTQALFEPDYGSVLRHLTPVLILMLLYAWRGAAQHQLADQ